MAFSKFTATAFIFYAFSVYFGIVVSTVKYCFTE